MMRAITAAVAGLAVAGCAETATLADRQSADYGREMSQAECETVARNNVLPYLKDPQSARITYSECRKSVAHSVPIFGLPKQAGYRIVANVNAKNSFGGYTGAQPWVMWLKDGKAIRRTQPVDGALIPY